MFDGLWALNVLKREKKKSTTVYERESFWLTSLITPIISVNLRPSRVLDETREVIYLAPKYYFLVTACFTPVNERLIKL